MYLHVDQYLDRVQMTALCTWALFFFLPEGAQIQDWAVQNVLAGYEVRLAWRVPDVG
jgi:hypothetical protein